MNDFSSLETEARELFVQGHFAEAAALFKIKVDQKPDDASAAYNLGVTLAKLERFEEALGLHRKAIELNPSFASAYANFAFCLNQLGLIAQARKGFAIARTLAPDDPVSILNEGIAALALGDYTPGWQGFAARWQLPAYAKFKRDFDEPFWRGEDLHGKTIFLYAEQGFGDSIQMARYIPVLAARGAKIILEMPAALTSLMQSLHGNPQVIVKGDSIPAFDTYCAMMDVPLAMGTSLETIPSETPYLFADAGRAKDYHKLLPQKKTRRIGIAWAGRSTHENDHNRSLPLSELAPLLAREDIAWVSLQRVVPDRDLAVLSSGALLDWGRAFADFSDAAAAIAALDLVITADSAVAHLAGALGKPVWVLLPYSADWRWLLERAESPWYPSARLFRQEKRGAWGDVITRVVDNL